MTAAAAAAAKKEKTDESGLNFYMHARSHFGVT